jgi:hypothetical protein
LLAERGDLEELRALADTGDAAGVEQYLFELLTTQGRAEEAERLKRFGLNPDGSIADEDSACAPDALPGLDPPVMSPGAGGPPFTPGPR